jgi:hypothetical protein
MDGRRALSRNGEKRASLRRRQFQFFQSSISHTRRATIGKAEQPEEAFVRRCYHVSL